MKTHAERRLDDDEPVTKGFLRHELSRYATKEDLQAMKDEILYHFDAVVEKIEEDLKGANADEISLLGNRDDQLAKRVSVLEEQVGLTPAA